MSSDDAIRADRILDAILAALDEQRLQTRIDEPIDTVLWEFIDALEGGGDKRGAEAILTDFVGRVVQEGLGATPNRANVEALTLRLLEDHYEGLRSNGYFAALLDATSLEMGGMAMVLTQLADIIRNQQRQEHIEAVFTRLIDPSDWHLRCGIVEALMRRYRPFLPVLALDCAPSQLVEQIPAMICSVVGSGATAEGLTASHLRKAE